jgi:hypothetical protein
VPDRGAADRTKLLHVKHFCFALRESVFIADGIVCEFQRRDIFDSLMPVIWQKDRNAESLLARPARACHGGSGFESGCLCRNARPATAIHPSQNYLALFA